MFASLTAELIKKIDTGHLYFPLIIVKWCCF
jgi:hypothetical protein